MQVAGEASPGSWRLRAGRLAEQSLTIANLIELIWNTGSTPSWLNLSVSADQVSSWMTLTPSLHPGRTEADLGYPPGEVAKAIARSSVRNQI